MHSGFVRKLIISILPWCNGEFICHMLLARSSLLTAWPYCGDEALCRNTGSADLCPDVGMTLGFWGKLNATFMYHTSITWIWSEWTVVI